MVQWPRTLPIEKNTGFMLLLDSFFLSEEIMKVRKRGIFYFLYGKIERKKNLFIVR